MGLRLGEIAVLTFKKGSKYDNLFKIPLACIWDDGFKCLLQYEVNYLFIKTICKL